MKIWVAVLLAFAAGAYFGQMVTDHYWDRTPKQWWIDKQSARRRKR